MKRSKKKAAAALGLLAAASAVYFVLFRITIYGFDAKKLLPRKKRSAGRSCRRFFLSDDSSIFAYKTEFIV